MKKWDEVRRDEPGTAAVAATFSWLDAASHPQVVENLEEIVIREYVSAFRITALTERGVELEEIALWGVSVWPEDLEEIGTVELFGGPQIRRRRMARELLWTPSERKGYLADVRGPLAWNIPFFLCEGEWDQVVREGSVPEVVLRGVDTSRRLFFEHLGLPESMGVGEHRVEELFRWVSSQQAERDSVVAAG